jgi:hypothetical protein
MPIYTTMVNENDKRLNGEGLSLLQLIYAPPLISFLQTIPQYCYFPGRNEWTIPLNMFY